MGIEFQILDFIQGLRTPFGDSVMPLVTALGNAGIFWIGLTVLLLLQPKKRRAGCILLLALLFDLFLCNILIKPLAARVRPFDINTAVQLLIARPVDFSFPSGHTAASFASVAALYLAGEKKLFGISLVLIVLSLFPGCIFMCIIPQMCWAECWSVSCQDGWVSIACRHSKNGKGKNNFGAGSI